MKKFFFLLFTLLSILNHLKAQTGNALHFDGTNDFVSCGTNANLNITSSMTVEMWIKPDVNLGNGRWDRLVHRNFPTGYFFGGKAGSTNALTVVLNNNLNLITTPNNTVTVGVWQHVAFVFDDANNTVKIYKNGTEVASASYTGTITGGSNNFTLSEDGEPYQGNMDEVRVWNVARTQTQINDNKSVDISNSTSGLVAYFKFNTGTAGGNNAGITTLTDATSNAINGTLTNFALTGSTSNWVATSLSADADLSALAISAGTLSPIFNSNTTSYNATVSNNNSNVTVTPNLSNSNASIQVRVNGGSYTSVTNGNASSALSLNVGSNTIDVRVTAQDGTTFKTYTITITRLQAAPTITSFSPLLGKPSDVVTITGNNFNTTTNNNIVFFGATRATVTAATATSLTVTVPIGATFAPINVLNTESNLACGSISSFNPIFSPAKSNINSNDFASAVSYSTGSGPHAVAAGDVDNDGKVDLVVANRTANSISILRNTGSSIGTLVFDAPINITVSDAPTFIAINDIDGDGKPDVLVARADGATISVLRNTSTNGNISFATAVAFTTGTSPAGINVADLDGDGKLDVAVSHSGSAYFSILRNISSIGTIALEAKVDIATDASGNITIADFDGDNKLDIAAIERSNNRIIFFRNTSSVGVLSFTNQGTLNTGSSPRAAAIADIDGDGKIDCATINLFGNNVSVFRNTSTSGTISFANQITYATASGDPIGLAFGDIDGDSKPDLVAVNTRSAPIAISVLRNTSTSGNISFNTQVPFGVGGTPRSVVLADFDGDSRLDIVTANGTGQNVTVIRNTSNNVNLSALTISNGVLTPSFTPTTTNYAATVNNAVTNIRITATKQEAPISSLQLLLNSNDFVSLTSGSPSPQLALNVGNNIIEISVTAEDQVTTQTYTITITRLQVPPTVTSFTPTNAKPGDAVTITGTNFNTTTTNNIVFFGATRATVTAATATSLTVTVPTGATFAPITVLNTGTSLAAYSLASFTPTYSLGKTGISNSDFANKVDISVGSNTYTAAIGDLDGDGKPDVVVTNANDHNITVLQSIATSGTINASSFATGVNFATGNTPLVETINDLDGDGKPEIIVANYSSGTISVFKNTTTTASINNSSFAAKVDFATGSLPFSVAVNDVDNDGKPDLIVACIGTDSISILKNISTAGNINFNAKVDFVANDNPTALTVCDIDGDGKQDIAAVNNLSNNIAVFHNTSTTGVIDINSFASKVNFTTNNSPNGIVAGDIDGDGKIDLVVSSGSNSNISVYRNTATAGSITSGSFATRVNFSVGVNQQYVKLSDLDGNGKLDIVSGNSAANSIYVLRNTSTPGTINSSSFASSITISNLTSPRFATIGDLDGDAKPDIATANFNNGNVSIIRNNDIPLWNGTTWQPSAPSVGTDAVIASNVAPASFTTRGLYINNGFSLNTTGITANIKNNIVNNGNGIAGTGTVAINANSTISGNSVTIPNNATLNLVTGTLTTGGLLRIAPGGSIIGNYANISGTVTLQQSIIGQRGWRIFAHPFTTTQTFSSLASTNGITINTNNGAAGIADVRTFSNATNQWTNAGTSTTANTTYGLFIRGLASEVTGLNYTGGPTPFTYSVSGTLNGNSVNYQAASTSNTFIVGNPFAAPVTTAALTNGTGKPYFTYQITQGATQQDRRTRAGAWIVASGNSSTTATIPILGVLAYQPTSTNSYSVSITDINTGGTVAANLFRTNNVNKPLEQLELNISSNGTLQDRWLLRYNQAAKNEGKDMNDLKKLRNDIINFYSVLNNKAELAVDARTSIARVPLGITAPIGTYNITVGENTLPGGEQLYLHDKLLNSYTQLQPNASYQFSVTADSNSRGNDRFELVTQKKATINNATNNNKLQVMVLNNIVTQQQATIQVLGNKGAVSIQMVDAAGNVQQTITGIQSGIQRINVTPKSKGMYWLRSSDKVVTTTSKLIVQ